MIAYVQSHVQPGGFEPHEWEIMNTHAALGGKLLHGTDSPYLVMGAEIADGHHERWDGGGYPAYLQGDAIPLSARLMNICDQGENRGQTTFSNENRGQTPFLSLG